MDLLKREAYAYDLPKELIAQYPLETRDASRLMHVSRADGTIRHRAFSDLISILKPDDVLVVNNSKVFPARLYGEKDNGTQIEVLLLNPGADGSWECLVHPGKRLKNPQWLKFSPTLSGYVGMGDEEGIREIKFESDADFWSEIHRIGHVPLPPYISRDDSDHDRDRYQTVYASQRGSVAAPTAGLHFTKELISALKAKGIMICEITLHVGIGTFRPVKCEYIIEHKMHSECAEISEAVASQINASKESGRRIITVGTTTTRTLESFWGPSGLESGIKWTNIFIYPGYQFRVTDAMITNFHLPESTLLMMISAFGGYELIKGAYAQAVAERYRFFSYGDAMLIE